MNNKNTLLACALVLFAGRGYEAVGVREIVEAACITRADPLTLFRQQAEPAARPAVDYQGDLPLSLHRLGGI
jgi:TetR/AcrR family transcriptional regulator